MLSIDYGFSTTVKRSGHAACWCAALGGIVQFGGWPPSEQLGDVVRHEGSSCPLYFMPVTTIARHLLRADQRRSRSGLEVFLAPHRQRRLRTLLGVDQRAGEAAEKGHETNTPEKATVADVDATEDPGASVAMLSSPVQSVLSATTEEVSDHGFVYDEGYVSEAAESEEESLSASSSSSSSPSSSPVEAGEVNDAERERAARHRGADGDPTTDIAAAPAPDPFTVDVSPSAPAASHDGVVAPLITVDLLRQVAQERGDRITYGEGGAAVGAGDDGRGTPGGPYAPSTAASQGRTSVSRSTHTGGAASTLHQFNKSGHQGVDREAPPVQTDTQEVLGKHTVRPLRWHLLRPPVAPRTRHGHHLVSCGHRIYVMGGSYWAHGNALASTDMMYDVQEKAWQQVSSLFPPRFCAALAKSNAVPRVRWMPKSCSNAQLAALQGGDDPRHHTATAHAVVQPHMDDQVYYYFGGLNYSRQLTNSLYRLWLPQETLEEMPQYGAVPREQFKGILVCDVQRECNPEERKQKEQALGRLFYIDGLQDGRPMAPYLRVYNLATGVWVRVCPAPDLVRSQVSLLEYVPIENINMATEPTPASSNTDKGVAKPEDMHAAAMTVTRLKRFEVVGGMPSRRGKQRRSRMCYSFDALERRFDYSHALPVPGLTAHCTVPLPFSKASKASDSDATADEATRPIGVGRLEQRGETLLADGVTTLAAYDTAVSVLREMYGVWLLCCGGNEDWNEAEQNSLGDPVGWLYLFTPRTIPLSEMARVQMECLRIPMIVPGARKDELLDELF